MNDAEHAILADLTDAQRSAVTHVDGPLLVLAGAGSGKTRVITRRVAWMVEQGIAGRHILAVTFTNKAANEMKERIEALLAARPADDWGTPPTVATFHSFAARILRICHERAGLPADYSIYDQSDRSRAIKLAIERVGLSAEQYPAGRIEPHISGLKNRLIDAAQFAASAANFYDQRVAEIYGAYEKVLREADALDFDDLLLRLARMLADDKAFQQELADRYRYILIDEYQDTNAAQYQIVRSLARPANNVCATGDPDQSIYGWRGAELENILRFERDFPDATVVRLEQNYRSTKRILAAADGLIRNNRRRKHKGLWTENPEGEKIAVVRCTDPQAEAELLADRIETALAAGVGYSQMAVFMRLNALTRVPEDVLRRRRIPYQIARGTSFYGRKEIKDATCYLRLLVNRADRVALERVINTPARGIGQTTVDRLAGFADAAGIDLWQACLRAAGQGEPAPALGRGAAAVKRFVELIEGLSAGMSEAPSVQRVLEDVLRDSGLADLYADDENASANLGELVTAVAQFDAETDFAGTLGDYLVQAALISDVDAIDESLGAVTLMTLHAAKGLEFDRVFIIGCERGLIPHEREDHVRDEEEERRLFFVGITRARKELTLTHTAERMLHGRTVLPSPSPFLNELPPDVLDIEDQADNVPAQAYQPDWPRRSRWNEGGGRGGWRRRSGSQDARPDVDTSEFDAPSRHFARQDADALRQAEQETAEEQTGWSVGALVRHATFGVGKVVRVAPSGPYTKATIDFRKGGLKAVILELAPVQRLLG